MTVREIWQRVRWIFRPPRGLKFTREGKYYVAFTLGVGAAALNTGNNLLFLILGLQLSVIILSGILSESVIRDLEVERLLPSHATAGQAAIVALRAANVSARFPSLTILLEDRAVNGRVSLARVPPRGTVEATYRLVPARRGRLAFEELRIITRFPFGLFEKWRTVRAPGSLLVFPAPVAAAPARRRPAAREGEQPQQRPGTGLEFHGLRDYRPGDDARTIHWRTSARTGNLVVVERQRDHKKRVALILDNRARGETDEAALDPACSVAAHHARRAIDEGCELGLVAAGGLAIAPASGAEQLRRVLTALALLGWAAPDAAAPRLPATWGAEALDIAA